MWHELMFIDRYLMLFAKFPPSHFLEGPYANFWQYKKMNPGASILQVLEPKQFRIQNFKIEKYQNISMWRSDTPDFLGMPQ